MNRCALDKPGDFIYQWTAFRWVTSCKMQIPWSSSTTAVAAVQTNWRKRSSLNFVAL